MMMKASLLAGVALLAGTSVSASAPVPITAAVAMRGRVMLSLTLRRGFPMIAGEVNGRPGYFMLDTGTPYAAFLNSDYLKLPDGKEVARGAAGSGQTIVVARHGCMASLTIARVYTLDTLCGLNGSNLRFVADELDLKFLGFIGYELFKAHRLTVDFARQEATLSDRTLAVEQNPVAIFRFDAADRNVPKLKIEAGDITIAGHMDTGAEGEITLTKENADALVAAGRLEQLLRKKGEPRYVLRRIDHDGVSLDSADLPVTIAAKSNVVLGFKFLKNYRSVWNFTDRTVWLYQLRPRR